MHRHLNQYRPLTTAYCVLDSQLRGGQVENRFITCYGIKLTHQYLKFFSPNFLMKIQVVVDIGSKIRCAKRERDISMFRPLFEQKTPRRLVYAPALPMVRSNISILQYLQYTYAYICINIVYMCVYIYICIYTERCQKKFGENLNFKKLFDSPTYSLILHPPSLAHSPSPLAPYPSCLSSHPPPLTLLPPSSSLTHDPSPLNPHLSFQTLMRNEG